MAERWALITGTSTGLGRACALRLAGMGVNVLAGVRRPQDFESLRRAFASQQAPPGGAGRLEALIVDVADEAAAARATERAAEVVGEAGLWALVNNAGVLVPGPAEHLTMAEWRRQFDVNFFGMVAMTRGCMPLLRLGVRAHGFNRPRIVLVSSIGGRVAQPMIAAYTASKFATTALGDSLRLELKRHGIGVMVAEPGAVATAIWGKGEADGAAMGPEHPARIGYGAEMDGLIALAARMQKAAIRPEAAAETLIRGMFKERAPSRLLIGRDARAAALLRKWLPLSWFDALLLREFGMAGLGPRTA